MNGYCFLPSASTPVPPPVTVASQAFGYVQTADQAGNPITQLVAPRDSPVLNGNHVEVDVSIGNNVTVSVTDDKGGTYTQVQTIAGGQRLYQFIRENVTDGMATVIVNFGGGGATHASCSWHEKCGIKASGSVDKKSTRTGTSTTPNSNAITPTNNCRVDLTAIQDSSSAFLASWLPTAPAEARTADLPWTFVYTQTQRYTAGSGAIIPTVTMNTSRGWTCGAIAFIEDDTQGTSPSGFRVDSQQYNSFPAAGISSPLVVQCPAVGAGGMLLQFQLNPGVTVTALTDSDGDTWQSIGSGANGLAGRDQLWLLDNPTQNSAKTVSCTFTGAAAGIMVGVFRLKKSTPAKTIGFDAPVVTTGSEILLSVITGGVVNPSRPTGMLFRLCGVQSNTVIGITGSGVFVADTSTPTIASPADLWQNNAGVIKHNPAAGDAVTYNLDGPPHDYVELAVALYEI